MTCIGWAFVVDLISQFWISPDFQCAVKNYTELSFHWAQKIEHFTKSKNFSGEFLQTISFINSAKKFWDITCILTIKKLIETLILPEIHYEHLYLWFNYYTYTLILHWIITIKIYFSRMEWETTPPQKVSFKINLLHIFTSILRNTK